MQRQDNKLNLYEAYNYHWSKTNFAHNITTYLKNALHPSQGLRSISDYSRGPLPLVNNSAHSVKTSELGFYRKHFARSKNTSAITLCCIHRDNMRYITPLAEITWEVWNRDNTFDAVHILYEFVPLRFHKGHHR